MAEAIDRVPGTLSPAKRRHFQRFKKAYHKKWPFVTTDEKGDTYWTLKFAVLLLNDCTCRQSSMIGELHSRLRGINKGGARCRLPCDFPFKSGCQIYLIKVGICLLMCS